MILDYIILYYIIYYIIKQWFTQVNKFLNFSVLWILVRRSFKNLPKEITQIYRIWWLNQYRKMVFVLRPTYRTSMAQGLFRVDPGAWPNPTRTWHFQKCLGPRQDSPKKDASGAGRSTQPLQRGLKPGGGTVPWSQRYIQWQDTRPEPSIASWPAEICPINWICRFSKGREVDICQCLPPDKAWHKVKSPKAD